MEQNLEVKLLNDAIDALRKDYDLVQTDHGRTAIADLWREHEFRLKSLLQKMET